MAQFQKRTKISVTLTCSKIFSFEEEILVLLSCIWSCFEATMSSSPNEVWPLDILAFLRLLRDKMFDEMVEKKWNRGNDLDFLAWPWPFSTKLYPKINFPWPETYRMMVHVIKLDNYWQFYGLLKMFNFAEIGRILILLFCILWKNKEVFHKNHIRFYNLNTCLMKPCGQFFKLGSPFDRTAWLKLPCLTRYFKMTRISTPNTFTVKKWAKVPSIWQR